MPAKLISINHAPGFSTDLALGLKLSLEHQGFKATLHGQHVDDCHPLTSMLNREPYYPEQVYAGLMDWAKEARQTAKVTYELMQDNHWVIWENQVCPYLFLTEPDPKRDDLINSLKYSKVYGCVFTPADHTYVEYSQKWLQAKDFAQAQALVGEFHRETIQAAVDDRMRQVEQETQGNEAFQKWKDENLHLLLAIDPCEAVKDYWMGQWRRNYYLTDWASKNQVKLSLDVDAEGMLEGSGIEPKLFNQAILEWSLFSTEPELKHADLQSLRLSEVFNKGFNHVQSQKAPYGV